MTIATRNRRIRQTYETFTPKSVEQGEAAESGWIDQEGVLLAPDEWDLDEEDGDEIGAVINLAVQEITSQGFVEPSSSQYHRGVWYSTIDDDLDYITKKPAAYARAARRGKGWGRIGRKLMFSSQSDAGRGLFARGAKQSLQRVTLPKGQSPSALRP